MRSAIGNAMLFNIMVTVIVIMIAFLAGSLSYSKAFRVKNNIINTIERDRGFNRDNVEAILKEIGYRVVVGKSKCVDRLSGTGSAVTGVALANSELGDYRYCVYRYDTALGSFFAVTAYMYFDFPVVSSLLEIPIYGETKIIYKD